MKLRGKKQRCEACDQRQLGGLDKSDDILRDSKFVSSPGRETLMVQGNEELTR